MTAKCKQCGREFEPRSKVNVYHDRQCQLDARAGRTRAESERRAETGFAWPVIEPTPHLKVHVPARRQTTSSGKWATCVILPDQQFGYRQLQDGTFQPFHDPRAIDIAEQVIEAERPNLTVMLGDLNDLAAYGKYRQEPSFIPATQRGLDRASKHVATVAALSKETRVIQGNHDVRLENSVLDNALASAGLRRARRKPGEYPVLTVPYLLGIADMPNVSWVGGYPAGATYINENLAAIHGRKTGPSASKNYLNDERVSIVAGHTHHIIDEFRTRNHHGKPKFTRFFSPGCLCRIDGAVPGTVSGLDPWLRPAVHWYDWQEGLAVVRYQEGNGKFAVEMIPIFEGWAMHRGQEFTSSKSVEDPE